MSGQLQNEYEELVREPRKVRWVWLVYLLLYAIAIPWYWPAGYRGHLVAGFPIWVVVTLVGVLLLAGWTLWVIANHWRVRGGEK